MSSLDLRDEHNVIRLDLLDEGIDLGVALGLASGFFSASKLFGKFEDGCWMRSADGTSTLGTTIS